MVEDDLRIDGMNVSFSLIFEKSTDPFLKSLARRCVVTVIMKVMAIKSPGLSGIFVVSKTLMIIPMVGVRGI